MLDDIRLHRGLVGQVDSRAQLNTPALVIDLDALDRNLQKMASFAQASGVALRPHAKTHKSVDVAKRQLTAGAVGLCCAKLGEAEALADGGVEPILITSPVVAAAAVRRLAALNARTRDLAVVVDHPDNAAALAAATRGRMLNVLIDIDPGNHRTGVASPAAAVALLEAVRKHGLVYRGVQFYCGVQQHIADYAERDRAIAERMEYLQTVIAALCEHGGAPEIVTGSGTGTHRIDAALARFTEWQVGSYVFMDRQYAQCALASDGSMPYEHSLFVDATVVSANTPGMATIDAGYKALSTDGGMPGIVSGAPSDTTYRFMGDEHGALVDPKSAHRWQIGERVQLAVPHCDPTVNLYDAYHVVRGDTLVDIWPVSARGRSR